MVKKIIVLAIFAYFISSICLAEGIKIDFKRYSVNLPETDWTIAQKDEDNQIVRFMKVETQRENSQIIITYVPVLSQDLWEFSEEELAKNYIVNEKFLMEEMGVKRGMYKLANVVEGIDNVDGKKFYTMSYQNIVKQYIVDGLLYVYVPPAEQHKELFAIVFTNGHRKNKPPASSLDEFIEILKSLEIR